MKSQIVWIGASSAAVLSTVIGLIYYQKQKSTDKNKFIRINRFKSKQSIPPVITLSQVMSNLPSLSNNLINVKKNDIFTKYQNSQPIESQLYTHMLNGKLFPDLLKLLVQIETKAHLFPKTFEKLVSNVDNLMGISLLLAENVHHLSFLSKASVFESNIMNCATVIEKLLPYDGYLIERVTSLTDQISVMAHQIRRKLTDKLDDG